MIFWSAIITVAAVFVYWVFFAGYSVSTGKRWPSALTVILAACTIALLLLSTYLERPDYSYTPDDSPLAIAIIFDLSPSMLAIPDPSIYPDTQARFYRGLSVLQQLIRTLEERQVNVLVSMTGFTRRSEIILGWESNVSQIREIMDYVISPDLFTSSGTNLEEAIKSMVRVFNILPQNLQENSQKIAILLSDGEDTMPFSYLDYGLKQLANSSFDVIALHTGLVGVDEGVPEYGEFEEFLHFHPMGGKLYTIPDAQAMMRIADAANRGMYVKAEDAEAVEKILQFIGSTGVTAGGIDQKIGIILGIFVFVVLFLMRLLY